MPTAYPEILEQHKDWEPLPSIKELIARGDYAHAKRPDLRQSRNAATPAELSDAPPTASRESQLEAALQELVDWLHVDMEGVGLFKGKPVLFGGPVGAQACLCVSENYMWDAILAAIAGRLRNAKTLLEHTKAQVIGPESANALD